MRTAQSARPKPFHAEMFTRAVTATLRGPAHENKTN
jgi:hypothetical protein